MNELFDKVILRFFLALFVCLLLVIYRYSHRILYPSTSKQLFKNFYPSRNSADSIHLFARILGVGILFSELHFYLSDGLLNALLVFSIQSIIVFAFYLISINIIESMILYNFEYADEIHKRKNYAYSIICATQALSMAWILKTVLKTSQDSIVIIFFLTLFSIVLMGFASKSFSFVSKLPFNKLLVSKNPAIAFSYMGFLWGWTLIISSSLSRPLVQIDRYALEVLLNIILSLLILPIFRIALVTIFRIKDDAKLDHLDMMKDIQSIEVGYGLYEGIIFFTACLLTTLITGHIVFGTFYPIF
jgi:hypothetical protein